MLDRVRSGMIVTLRQHACIYSRSGDRHCCMHAFNARLCEVTRIVSPSDPLRYQCIDAVIMCARAGVFIARPIAIDCGLVL